MKVKVFEKRRRWNFHSSTFFASASVFVVICLTATHGLVVDVPAQDYSPLTRFFGHSYGSESLVAKGVQSIFKVPNLTSSCSRDMKRFVGQLMTLVGHQIPGNNETVVENWALQSMYSILIPIFSEIDSNFQVENFFNTFINFLNSVGCLGQTTRRHTKWACKRTW